MASEIDFDEYDIVNTGRVVMGGALQLPVTQVLTPAYVLTDADCYVEISAAAQGNNGSIVLTIPLANDKAKGRLYILNNQNVLNAVTTGLGHTSVLSPGSITYLLCNGSSWVDITPSSGLL